MTKAKHCVLASGTARVDEGVATVELRITLERAGARVVEVLRRLERADRLSVIERVVEAQTLVEVRLGALDLRRDGIVMIAQIVVERRSVLARARLGRILGRDRARGA